MDKNLISKKIEKLNENGKTLVFVVTGNNSTGKTTTSMQLIRDFPIYQYVSLGIFSKLIRFFRPELTSDDLENFNGNIPSRLFRNMLDFVIDHYSDKGVNTVIDGVQIDTKKLTDNTKVTGGVILKAPIEIAVERGNYPKTHFKRKLQKDQMKSISYTETEKFKVIENNGNFEDTYTEILKHLEKLL